MPNIATALKAEIARIARKELRAELDHLKKTSASYRSAIAALKRQVGDLERQVVKATGAGLRKGAQAATEPEVTTLRFSSKGLKSHRAKLGVSAADYGRLVGVSGLSIYKWEKGEVRPRRAQIHALAQVRALGKREAASRLNQGA